MDVGGDRSNFVEQARRGGEVPKTAAACWLDVFEIARWPVFQHPARVHHRTAAGVKANPSQTSVACDVVERVDDRIVILVCEETSIGEDRERFAVRLRRPNIAVSKRSLPFHRVGNRCLSGVVDDADPRDTGVVDESDGNGVARHSLATG